MADVYCPLCGKKNWIPDGAESACFFCGTPLSPRTDFTQDAPQPKPEPKPKPPGQPETDASPFIKQVLVVPAPDPSAETGAPAEMNAEARFSRAEYHPSASVHYRMTEMVDLPAKQPRKKLRLRQWFLMNTVFICTQSFLAQYLVYLNRTDGGLLPLFGILLMLSVIVMPYISNYLCPDKTWKPEKDADEISFGGIVDSIVFTGSVLGIFAGAFIAKLFEGIIDHPIVISLLAVQAGAVCSFLVHYFKAGPDKKRK